MTHAHFPLVILALLLPPLATAQLATAPVVHETAAEHYPADGVVEATRQSLLSAQTPGRVIERPVEAGDTVRRGQLLVRIDDREAAQVESAAQAQLAAAQAQLTNATAELERTRGLFQQRFVSQAAVDQAEAAYRTARAQVNALRASAGVSTTQRSQKALTAPYDGLIAQVSVQVGDLAVPGRALLTVYDPTELRVIASLPQAQIGVWRREGAVRVLIGAREVTARAATVLPLTDTASQVVQVRLDLPRGLEGVLPGTFVKALFPVGTRARLRIPPGALFRRGEMAAVYVVGEGERVSLRQVRPGQADDNGVEILAGLSEGERVALDPVAAARAVR